MLYFNAFFFLFTLISGPLKVAEDDSLKVTDVGFSKPAVEITGTLAGTPVYIAPEVIHSQVYDCKADIYSLGIILWEIWYGQRAYYNVKPETVTGLFSLVDDDYRPEHVKGCEQPCPRWKQLMEKCWDKNPKQRPTASKCHEEITAFSSEVRKIVNSCHLVGESIELFLNSTSFYYYCLIE